MIAVLVFLRDAFMALLLSWVGIGSAPSNEPHEGSEMPQRETPSQTAASESSH